MRPKQSISDVGLGPKDTATTVRSTGLKKKNKDTEIKRLISHWSLNIP